jgi:hypothetical protein
MASKRVTFFLLFLIFIIPTFAQVTSEDLKGDFKRIEREAKKVTGFYYGLKEKDHLRRYETNGCNFLYEKGMGQHPENDKEYAFERFMISFSGVDKNKVTSFDSVVYGHSAFLANFKGLDFSKSFPYQRIKRVEFDNARETGEVKAIRTDLGELHLLFRHQEIYNAEKSSFFKKGEQREYQLEVQFSDFKPNRIKLKKVLVKTMSIINGRKKAVVQVLCENF